MNLSELNNQGLIVYLNPEEKSFSFIKGDKAINHGLTTTTLSTNSDYNKLLDTYTLKNTDTFKDYIFISNKAKKLNSNKEFRSMLGKIQSDMMKKQIN